MNSVTILLVAVGLAMDAFAVSISSGAIIKKLQVRHALMLACSFGIFQAVMPLIGWGLTSIFSSHILAVGPWIAFGLLVFIGLKMLYESHFLDEEEEKKNPLNLRVLFVMAFATSIDALAVGVSISALHVDVFVPVVVIGIVTFCFSFAGAYIGKAFGHIFEKNVEIAGGLVLIGIGIKILVSHLLSTG